MTCVDVSTGDVISSVYLTFGTCNYTITQLNADIQYDVCVECLLISDDVISVKQCQLIKTIGLMTSFLADNGTALIAALVTISAVILILIVVVSCCVISRQETARHNDVINRLHNDFISRQMAGRYDDVNHHNVDQLPHTMGHKAKKVVSEPTNETSEAVTSQTSLISSRNLNQACNPSVNKETSSTSAISSPTIFNVTNDLGHNSLKPSVTSSRPISSLSVGDVMLSEQTVMESDDVDSSVIEVTKCDVVGALLEDSFDVRL